jgi:hypothetical protein
MNRRAEDVDKFKPLSFAERLGEAESAADDQDDIPEEHRRNRERVGK